MEILVLFHKLFDSKFFQRTLTKKVKNIKTKQHRKTKTKSHTLDGNQQRKVFFSFISLQMKPLPSSEWNRDNSGKLCVTPRS